MVAVSERVRFFGGSSWHGIRCYDQFYKVAENGYGLVYGLVHTLISRLSNMGSSYGHHSSNEILST